MRASDGAGRADRWYRLAATILSAAFVLCAIQAVSAAYSGAGTPDFLSYWAAGRLTFEGHPAWTYDLARHHAVEQQVMVAAIGTLPFPYPPAFLLALVPFGIAPFWIAFGIWMAVTASLYVAASSRMIDVRFSLAQAAASANFITGQNGFLTSAIFLHGTELLSRRPLVAGLVLGLLSFKPQLALLLPVALLAGREWRAIAGGIICSLTLALLALLLFGEASYEGFLATLPYYTGWLDSGRWSWTELASMFALLRYLGVPQGPALVIHAVIALGAAAMTAHSWATRSERRVPILAAATLLVPPYLFTYDALLLTVPIAFLLRQENRFPFIGVWLLSLVPLLNPVHPIPNVIPIAALLALWAIHRAPSCSALPSDADSIAEELR
jgi:hypothetical protein